MRSFLIIFLNLFPLNNIIFHLSTDHAENFNHSFNFYNKKHYSRFAESCLINIDKNIVNKGNDMS